MRPLPGLLVAEAVSMAGSRVSTVAVPWLVLTTTGSATRTGVVAFAQLLPFVLAGVVGGPLVDRLGIRRTAIGSDLASAITVGSVPLLQASGHLSYGMLVALMVAAGACGGLGDTAKRALLPRAIEASGATLTRGATLYDGIGRAAMLLGLPLGGILVAAVGPAGALALDAGSFAFCALLTATVVRITEIPVVPGSYVRALGDGFAFLRRDTVVLAVVGVLFWTNLVDQAYTVVLVPAWVRDHDLDPVAIGLVGGVFGLGAVLGNLVFLALASRLPRRVTLGVSFLIAGAPRLFALAGAGTLAPVLAVAFGAGLAAATLNPILTAAGYERIPTHLHARVLGVAVAIGWLGIPLGGLLGGVAVDGLGLHAALVTGGVLYLVVSLTPFVLPQWRALDLAHTLR
ncbi:MFS transporter [Symbioplanes lichenis]|uniref:MFS transporter n=1 Tax=Symbioplanes lichenis TaxID=1629072 RepID=UPI0027386A09|nr:MFS transporter [Actinoplanes lichenis]